MEMSNMQTRLMAAAIALLAGAILCTSDQVNINVGLAILIVSAALFAVEYFRMQKS
jgi:uncharacterized membrane protein